MDSDRPDLDVELPPEAEAVMAELLAAQRARRDHEDAHRRAKRSLWLAHHWPDEYDRCAVVAGRHVCRRCLWLYPAALLTMALALAGFTPWPQSLDPWFVWGLCLPATADFLAEKLRDAPYDARRQQIVTLLLAPALGRGLAVELDDRWSWTFWGPVLVFGTVWFLAAVARVQRSMFQAALDASLERARPESGAPG